MRLSPTAVLQYEACPHQYYLDRVLGLRPRHQAANLVFGGVVHRVVETWLRGWLRGPAPDAAALFDAAWQTAREAGGIDYASTQSPESLTATGRALVAQFAAAWPGFGLLPALDGDGEPVLERKLEVPLAPGVVFAGQPDLVVLDADGALGCLDLKTPSSPTDPAWLAGADQLTGYQLLLDAHAERLGLPPVARLGLVELVKRKVTPKGKGPEVCPPVTVARRAPRGPGRLHPKGGVGGRGHRPGPVSEAVADGPQLALRAVRLSRVVPGRRPRRRDPPAGDPPATAA